MARGARIYAVTRVSLESGAKQQVTFPPGQGGDNAVALSPNGRILAFTRLLSDTEIDLYTVPLSEQYLPTRAAECRLSGAWVESIAWTPDSRELVFAGNAGEKEGLWRIGVFGSKKPKRLAGIGPSMAPTRRQAGLRSPGRVNLSISREGRRLAYGQEISDHNIWRVAVGRDEEGKAARFISSTRDETNPAFSPDGQKIAFESDRSGTEEIWVCNADGSAPFQLTNFGSGWSGTPQWSTDGLTIVFDRLEAKQWDIYSVKSQGGKPIRMTTNERNNNAPSWSRDGRWIYLDSDRTGRFEIWKIPAVGGLPVQVTKNGGGAPLESADGNELYYSKMTGLNTAALWKTPVKGGAETKLLEHMLRARAYAIAKQGIYFVESAHGTPLLRLFDFKTQRIATVVPLQGFVPGCRITISPDQLSVLYSQDDGVGADLMLVENFH